MASRGNRSLGNAPSALSHAGRVAAAEPETASATPLPGVVAELLIGRMQPAARRLDAETRDDVQSKNKAKRAI